MQNKVLILDFGSQYTQLIARRVRELNIYCEIFPYNKIPINLKVYKSVILSGSPFSVRDDNSPKPDLSYILDNLPVLAVCYGAQLIAQNYGGLVSESNIREYGRANLSYINSNDLLFSDISEGSQVWMSHSDTIKNLPINATLIASTNDVQNAAYRINDKDIYALQFHPEVYHTTDGKKLLQNFLINISKLTGPQIHLLTLQLSL